MTRMHKGKLEEELFSQYDFIIGVDEVGRGCIAGETCAAAVIINLENFRKLKPKERNLIRDSKLLSRGQREKLVPVLCEKICLHFAIESSPVEDIDEIGIQKAIFSAMRKAIFKILQDRNCSRVVVLVDGHLKIPELKHEFIHIEQRPIVKGDQICFCIAAASILAKVARDQVMINAAKQYPQFGFESHVGYGTRQHLTALKDFGPTPLHRKSFAPVACYIN